MYCMQSKKRNVLSNLVFQTDWKLIPKTITCDFEVALLKAIQEEFSGDDVDIACYEIHWKRALRRKLLQFGLPTKDVSKMIGDGGTMEILTYKKRGNCIQRCSLRTIYY